MRSQVCIACVLFIALVQSACQSQMYKAKAVDGKPNDTDPSSEGKDSNNDSNSESDSAAESDSENDTDSANEPGPDDIWVKLTVNCDLEVCADGNHLKFYADLLKEDLSDGSNFYIDFGAVTFPFTTLLKKTSNMMGKEYDWPSVTLVGGVYYDVNEEDLKVAADIDPKTTGNIWNFQKGKINEVVLTLEDELSADDVWIDLTIECEEAVCSEVGQSFHFALYDGDEQSGAPDYYLELKNITYPFHQVVRRMNHIFGYPKYLPAGNVTGGGYHDSDPDDTTNGLPNMSIDPTDLHNTYPLKKGELNTMKLKLHLLPKEVDVWIKLTVYCDDPVCQNDGDLRFYAYDGNEETGDPDYFNSFGQVTFPFHTMIKASASYAAPGTPKTFPQANIIGGAFYDLDTKGSLFDNQDPQSRGSRLTLKAGELNEMVLTLTPAL